MKSRTVFGYLSGVFFSFCFLYEELAYGSIDLEVCFFDVGQGNCTVLGYKGIKENGHVMIVDAGSSEYEEHTKRSSKTQKTNIANKIKEFFPSKGTKKLTIVLTHADKDHYSWVSDILDNLNDKELKINFFCGGAKEDYKSTQKIFEGKNAIFTKDLKEEELPTIDFSPATCEVLAALKTDDTNTNSIVLKVAYTGRSVLLTGDATNKTITSIKEKNKLKTTILQLSHHGASDGCNSEEFIKACEPQACVISAGVYANMWHPKKVVIERAAKLPTLKKEALKTHLVRYYHDEELPLVNQYQIAPLDIENFCPLGMFAFPRKEFGYSLARTSLFLFTTSSNGTISFCFKGKEKEEDEEEELKYPTLEFNDITDFKKLQNSLKNYSTQLTSLNLSKLEINDDNLKEFFPVLPKNLISLSLENNKLTSQEKIADLLNTHTTLRELNLKGNNITSLTEIKNKWGNKGLELEDI